MERRSSGRLGINHEASIFTKDGYFTAILENISVGGLFLRTYKHIEIGEMIEITISLPNSLESKNITINVVAVRIMDNGAAFRFKDIDKNTHNALFNLAISAHA